MNHKIVLLLMTSLLAANFVIGQVRTGSIHGKVVSPDQRGIFSATIALRKNTDKTTVKFAATDSSGVFDFDQIPYGEYVVSITCVGFERFVTESFGLNSTQHNLEPVVMAPDVKDLKDVTITAVKPIIERRMDRTIVNVSSSVTMSGGTGLEVLAQSPGVTITTNGRIAIKGKEGTVVLIDGRQTYLTGADLTNYLRSLQANQIEKVEIISNPSARYDAAGNGIINIITQTEAKKGWGAAFALSYRQGKYANTADNVMLHYRAEKFNLGATFNYQQANGFQDYYVLRNLRDMHLDNIETVFDQNSYQKTRNISMNARINMDYYLNVKTVIGASVTYFDNPTRSSGYSTTLLKSPDLATLQRVASNTGTNGTWHNPGYNLNLRRAIGNKGQNLSLDANYLHYNTHDSQVFDNYFYKELKEEPDTVEYFRAKFPRTIKIGSAKADYELPITTKDKLEMGVRYSEVRSDNNALYYNEVSGLLHEDSVNSNHFVYRERIVAAYLTYKKQLDKFNMQAGLRIEKTSSSSSQLTTGQVNNLDYTPLFPSLSLEYKLNEDHSLGISYSRRIERPEYQNLNPFKYYIDKYTYEQGNPYLRPQISNNIELNYLLFNGFLSATLSYSRIDKPILSVVLQDIDRNETFLIPQNMNSSSVVGLNVSSTIPVFTGFTSTLNLDLNNRDIKGEVNGLPYTLSKLQFYGTMLNQYKFGTGWSAELYGQYASSSIDETFIRRPYGTISIGVSKSVLQKKGAIRLSGADIFYWDQFVASSRYQHVDVYADNRFQTRMIRLGFTYRINSTGKAEKEKEKPQEVERVKTKQ
ncbi:TonB-dependent receptor domain-containing protein [Chitinophaga sp. 30R24]|uniref:TonB-dependent receptor domain-containing protein n=1 Tax=Chitinophaga sp. 30R24 TaxID=3248838 RepID=UPI003B8EE1C2